MIKGLIFSMCLIVFPAVDGQTLGTAVSLNDSLKGWEITNNVTLALSRFSGNVTRNLNDDPYLMMVRKVNATNQTAWRVGINGFRKRTEDFSFNGNRTSDENSASLVLGREWRKDLGLGIYCFWGIDTRGIWRQNTSITQQFNDMGLPIEMKTLAQDMGGGIGGFGGIAWKLRDRITLYTESTLYGQYINTKREFIVNQNSTSLENKNTMSVLPLVPVALFLSVRF
jgi:hypothetical protein